MVGGGWGTAANRGAPDIPVPQIPGFGRLTDSLPLIRCPALAHALIRRNSVGTSLGPMLSLAWQAVIVVGQLATPKLDLVAEILAAGALPPLVQELSREHGRRRDNAALAVARLGGDVLFLQDCPEVGL